MIFVSRIFIQDLPQSSYSGFEMERVLKKNSFSILDTFFYF